MNKLLPYIFLFCFSPCFSQTLATQPNAVEAVLKKAGKNRPELEKAISYFQKSKDPLKLKAIQFLVSNMDIHFSQDYYWADSTGKRIAFNELQYPNLAESVHAFNELKSSVRGIHPVSFSYRDLDTIKADFLIENVERAFTAWKQSPTKNIPFNYFCEYILPYRVTTEPLQNWRPLYQEQFKWIADSAAKGGFLTAMGYASEDYKSWFTSSWGTEQGKEPLPNQGPLQLLFRKKGLCQDIAGLEVFTLRSQGIPSSFNFIPQWATTASRHFLNTVFDPQMQAIPLDVSRTPALDNKLQREPSKVFRVTYSKQPATLASFHDGQNIPNGFMRMQNYIDITKDYWPVADVNCKLFPTSITPQVAYACVFSGGQWRPVWWGKTLNRSVNFSAMCKGAVFMPAYYKNGRLMPAGYPVASGYNNQQVLQPDTLNKRTITIYEQEKYLVLRPGKRYKLLYWDNNWKAAGEKTAEEDALSLVFDNVPANALYLLVPEYSQKMERPFMITPDGKRVWW